MIAWEYVREESDDSAVESWLHRPDVFYVVVRLRESTSSTWYEIVVVTRSWILSQTSGLAESEAGSSCYIPHGLLILPDATGTALEESLRVALRGPGIIELAARERARQIKLSDE